MKSLVMLITGLFSFLLFDLNSLRRQRPKNYAAVTIELEYIDRKLKIKKTQRKYNNSKFKKRKEYRNRHFKYQETRPKDKRFSHQKALRRMYRNA